MSNDITSRESFAYEADLRRRLSENTSAWNDAVAAAAAIVAQRVPLHVVTEEDRFVSKLAADLAFEIRALTR